MQLLLVVAVVAALVLAEAAPAEPAGSAGWRLLLSLAGMALVALFATLAAVITSYRLRTSADRRQHWLRLFGWLRAVHAGLWLVVAAITLSWLGWPQLVRSNWRLEGTFLVDELLILAPVVLPMMLSWGAFYEVDAALATSAGGARPARGRIGYVLFHSRHYLGLLLIPVLLMIAVEDTFEIVAPGSLDGAGAWLLVVPLAMILIAFPAVMRRVWRTHPLPDSPLRRRLEATCRRCGLPIRELLIWHTDDRIVNAALAGFVPRWRYVLLTDALLARFDDDEVEAIVAHELGHVRRRHLPARLLGMLAPLLALAALNRAVPGGLVGDGALLAEVGLTAAMQTMLLMPLALALYLGLTVGGYCRLMEREADLFACGHDTDPNFEADHDDPLRQATATARYVAVLEKLSRSSGAPRSRSTWLHPSVATRVAFVRRMLADPAAARRFNGRMDCLRRAVVASVLAGVGVLLIYL